MKRWALVITERGSDREGKRRRLAAVAAVVGALVGSVVIGQVLATDPVAYGVPFWPFANSTDQAEQRLMSEVAAAAKAGAPVGNDAIEVVQSTERDGNVFLTLKLRVDAEQTRCREVLVRTSTDLDVSSRRVAC